MSIPQQEFILDEVVHLCNLFASVTSERLQGVQGGPVLEPYLAHSDKDTLEPLTVCESKCYFFREDLHPNRNWVAVPFLSSRPRTWKHHCFQQPNIRHHWLGRCWILRPFLDFYQTASLARSRLDLDPPIPGVEDIEWRRRLRVKLEEQGYPRFAGWFMEWQKSRSR